MPRQTRLRRTVNFARNKLEEGYEAGKERFDDAEETTVKYIKKNPIKSVAIAAGVGAIIGAALYLGIGSAVKSQTRQQSFWEKYNPRNLF